MLPTVSAMEFREYPLSPDVFIAASALDARSWLSFTMARQPPDDLL
jgi:hypothetical protein